MRTSLTYDREASALEGTNHPSSWKVGHALQADLRYGWTALDGRSIAVLIESLEMELQRGTVAAQRLAARSSTSEAASYGRGIRMPVPAGLFLQDDRIGGSFRPAHGASMPEARHQCQPVIASV
jgi:hypothetical protein